jgi:large subunit ribosomal protein L10
MARPEKEAAVAELTEALRSASGVYLADFTGLTVANADELRRGLREQGVRYAVVKNTLARLAVNKAQLEDLLPFLQGPTAVAIATEDAIAPARVLVNFTKEKETPKIKAGLVEGRLFEGKDVERLASLPPRDQLYAKLLGALQSPMVGVVGVLTGLMRNLVHALSEIEKKKQAAEGQAAS